MFQVLRLSRACLTVCDTHSFQIRQFVSVERLPSHADRAFPILSSSINNFLSAIDYSSQTSPPGHTLFSLSLPIEFLTTGDSKWLGHLRQRLCQRLSGIVSIFKECSPPSDTFQRSRSNGSRCRLAYRSTLTGTGRRET